MASIIESIDRDKVWETRYVSVDPTVSDFQPDEFYDIVQTSNAKMGITVDHGIVIRQRGRRRGEVAFHQGRELTTEEAERIEENTGIGLKRFNAYDFKIESLTQTDGPQRREKLARSHEQQKEDDQASMYKSLDTMITSITSKMNGTTTVTPTASPQDTIKMIQALAKENPDRAHALVQQIQMVVEDVNQEDVSVVNEKPPVKWPQKVK